MTAFEGVPLDMLVANFFGEMSGVNIALRGENHGALEDVS